LAHLEKGTKTYQIMLWLAWSLTGIRRWVICNGQRQNCLLHSTMKFLKTARTFSWIHLHCRTQAVGSIKLVMEAFVTQEWTRLSYKDDAD
jgi:hypothetical protein